jgi:hypothetical protein
MSGLSGTSLSGVYQSVMEDGEHSRSAGVGVDCCCEHVGKILPGWWRLEG